MGQGQMFSIDHVTLGLFEEKGRQLDMSPQFLLEIKSGICTLNETAPGVERDEAGVGVALGQEGGCQGALRACCQDWSSLVSTAAGRANEDWGLTCLTEETVLVFIAAVPTCSSLVQSTSEDEREEFTKPHG